MSLEVGGVRAYVVPAVTAVWSCQRKPCTARIAFVASEKSDRMPVNIDKAERRGDALVAPVHWADCKGIRKKKT